MEFIEFRRNLQDDKSTLVARKMMVNHALQMRMFRFQDDGALFDFIFSALIGGGLMAFLALNKSTSEFAPSLENQPPVYHPQ